MSFKVKIVEHHEVLNENNKRWHTVRYELSVGFFLFLLLEQIELRIAYIRNSLIFKS